MDCCDCSDEPKRLKVVSADCDPAACEEERFQVDKAQREMDQVIRAGLEELQPFQESCSTKLDTMMKQSKEAYSATSKFDETKADLLEQIQLEESIELKERQEESSSKAKAVMDLFISLVPSKEKLVEIVAQSVITGGDVKIDSAVSYLKEQSKEFMGDSEPWFVSPTDSELFDNAMSSVKSPAMPEMEKRNALIKALDLLRLPVSSLIAVGIAQSSHREFSRSVMASLGSTDATERLSGPLDDALNRFETTYVRVNLEPLRKRLRDVEEEERKHTSETERNEKFVKIDYGINGTMTYLLDKEVSLQNGEFTFKVKFFESAEQGSTNLGLYDSWKRILSDDHVPHELNEGLSIPRATLAMEFKNGLRCYQGTIRSASVYLRCGSTDVLLKVLEPEVCRYLFLVRSPVACAFLGGVGDVGDGNSGLLKYIIPNFVRNWFAPTASLQ